MEYIFRNLACFCIFFLLLSPIISFYLHNLEISQIIIKKSLLLHDLRFFSNVFWCRCSFKANHWISQTFHCSNLYLDSPLNHLSYISSLPSSPLNLLSAEFIKSIPFFHIHYLFIEEFFFSSSPFLHTQLCFLLASASQTLLTSLGQEILLVSLFSHRVCSITFLGILLSHGRRIVTHTSLILLSPSFLYHLPFAYRNSSKVLLGSYQFPNLEYF